MHVEHVQDPDEGPAGAFMPAAAQLNPPLGTETAGAAGAVATAAGRGASHTAHWSSAPLFVNMQVEHVHDPGDAAVGAFIPAAAQSNPLLGAETAGAGAGAAGAVAFATGRGASQTEH